MLSKSKFGKLRQGWRIIVASVILGGAALPALADCPSSAPGRFVPNGAKVTDMKTGLVWARCSVGQYWDGTTCSGQVKGMNLQSALAYAADQEGWRLPNAKELFSIVDKGCVNPAIDEQIFPNTKEDMYWTSTPCTSKSDDTCFIDFETGVLFPIGLSHIHRAIRLVRTDS